MCVCVCVCAKRDIASKLFNFCENVFNGRGANLRPSVRIIRNYIVKLHPRSPVILHDNNQRESYKHHGASTSVT